MHAKLIEAPPEVKAYWRDLTRARRQRYETLGRCITCGARQAAAGLKTCRPCADKSAATMRAYVAKRKAQGLCAKCETPVQSTTLCRRHLDEMNRADRRNRLPKRIARLREKLIALEAELKEAQP